MAPKPNPYSEFQSVLEQLKKLKLPLSVPVATKDSRISEVFASVPVPTNPLLQWQACNHRFDSLYGEDLRDPETGRLPNILRGKHGLSLVLKYMDECVAANAIPWDIALPKAQRLLDEVKAVIDAAPPAGKKTTGKQKNKTGGAAGTSKKRKRNDNGDGASDSSEDEDYQAPRRAPHDSDESDFPDDLMDTDGEEVVLETEKAKELKAKRAKKKARVDNATAPKTGAKKKRPVTVEDVEDIDSGEESDGQSAFRNAQEQAKKRSCGGHRGPANQSLQHFSGPVPGGKKGWLRWEWTCNHCVGDFPRTIGNAAGDNVKYEDEPVKPKLSNLPTHLRLECKKYQAAMNAAADEDVPVDTAPKFNLQASKDLMAAFVKEGSLNPASTPTKKGFLQIFSCWILDEDLPWTTGEAPLLRELFKYLRINMQLPSDTTVRNELARIFAQLHGQVVEEFSRISSKISYSTDTWTTRQMTYTFACTIASFIDDDWNLVERVIDFKALESNEHEGYYAARAFIKVTDNASVNDVIFKHAARWILSLYNVPEKPDSHIRCLAHVINLVVQAILAGLGEAEQCDAATDEDADYFLQNKSTPLHYDPATDISQIELEEQRKADLDTVFIDDDDDDDDDMGLGPDTFEEEVKELGLDSALKKLCFITTKIVSSPQRRQRFWKISERVHGDRRVDEDDETSTLLRLLMVIRDVRTRWNSTHGMLERALLLRDAIDEWIFRTSEYSDLRLTGEDWRELEALEALLRPFTEVTKQISSSSYPTIPFVLPLYHNMHAHLKAASLNTKLSIRIRSAVGLGLSKLNKYKGPAEKNYNYITATSA
ncbi:hypothetical protein NMY22_g19033 [Coprinellus aureogranulatus]|nr:hypothetical protein NMY22_g19033 [Coprinellus aureogranulatus]